MQEENLRQQEASVEKQESMRRCEAIYYALLVEWMDNND